MRSIFLATLALSACSTIPGVAQVRGDGLARLNEATRVRALVVTPLLLIEDSRCPIDARCVWAGRAILRAEVASGGRRRTIDLTLGTPVSMHDTTVTLISVEPGRLAGTQPRPAAPLTFGFEVGR